MHHTETIDGYVVDLACIRRYPVAEWIERGRRHTKECALMGHCIESGYGLVKEDGQVVPLDAEATPMVVAAIRRCKGESGIRVRAIRESEGSEMKTRSVEEIPSGGSM